MKPLNLERSPDTEAVIRVLYGVNDEISDADLANQARLHIKRVREVDQSARRYLEKNHNIWFARVTRWGFKRVEGFNRTKGGLKDLKSINRKAKRTVTRLEGTNTAEFTHHEMHLHAAAGMAASVIKQQSYMKLNPEKPKDEFKPQAAPLPNVTDLLKRKAKN